MLNSFMSVETLSRSLYIQQLNQDVIASNLAKTYVDSNGYLMSSMERLNVMEGLPLVFGGGVTGQMAVGSGPLSQSITRLRNLFLDSQIQTQSSVVGKSEILTNVLNQLNSILNNPGGTVDAAITNLANAFTALAPNPLSVALRSTVVNDGVAFANLAHTQFTQIEDLQKNLNGQIDQTVSDINGILQQLSSLNKQLLSSSGANVNDLLDARDYALDRLGRLINIQTNFGTAGTANVFLGGSSLSLVDSAGAAILQTNVLNSHNPGLEDVTIQSSEGTVTLKDASNWITGGNLGGELQARDAVLESYKDQLDQIVTSVMTITNDFHHAGYASDGTTTGINFFTGTSPRDIGVNAALVSDPTRKLLAASSRYGVANAATNGQIAQFIGNLRSVLANNDMESFPPVNAGGGFIDPTQVMTSAAGTALNVVGSNSTNFATIPIGGANTFTLNSTTVNYNQTTDTLYNILDNINAADPNVQAVFDYTNQKIMILSNNPILLTGDTGNFKQTGQLQNLLTSDVRMNNGFFGRSPNIVPGPGSTILNPWMAMFSTQQEPALPNRGPNAQAFMVTPGASGTFVINGVSFNWSNLLPPINNFLTPAQSLNNILAQINGFAWPVGQKVTAQFVGATQKVILFSPDVPIQILDKTGNFSVFTGLNGNTPVGNLSTGILTQVSSDLSNQNLVQGQASASLDQLNNAQADVSAVALNSGDHGVPIQTIQEQAVQSLIAFNASLQVLQVINQMFADLVGIVGGAPPPSPFQQRTF